MTANDKIRAFLAVKKYSQNYFADLCDVPHSRINDLVNPRKEGKLSLNLALPIAKHLGLTVEELCDEECPWPPPAARAKAPAGRQVALTEREVFALDMIRSLGIEAAIGRLLGAPVTPGPADVASWTTAEETIRQREHRERSAQGRRKTR